MGGSFVGNKVVLVAKFDPDRGAGASSSEEKVNLIMITGDAMGRPLIEALERARRRLRPLVAVRARQHGGDVLAVGEGPVLRALPEPRDHRRDRLVARAAPTAYALVSQGQHRDEGRARRSPPVARHRRARRGPRAGRARLRRRSASSPARGNIPLGYYKDPEKTAATFVTGPTARATRSPATSPRVEADGTITLLGRGSVSINSGGEKIFPEEVEAAVKSHPAVFDAVVVGVPDERWGQRVAAVVQPRDGRDADARGRPGALPHEDRRLQGAARAAPRRPGRALAQRQARLPLGQGGRDVRRAEVSASRTST